MVQVKSSDEAVILCKTSIGSLKLEINDLPATKVKAPKLSPLSPFFKLLMQNVPRTSFTYNMLWHISNVILLVMFTRVGNTRQLLNKSTVVHSGLLKCVIPFLTEIKTEKLSRHDGNLVVKTQNIFIPKMEKHNKSDKIHEHLPLFSPVNSHTDMFCLLKTCG